MRSIQSAGVIVLIGYWFHLLRNISPLYFLVLAALLFLFFISILRNLDSIEFDPFFWILFVFWIYASIVGFLQESVYGDSGIGLVRFWAGLPLAGVAMIVASGSISIKMRWLVFFYAVAALTFPLQYAIGPIEWFAEASERAGTDRFASLTGSLTSYGVSVGVASLAAFCFFSFPASIALFMILALGGVLSLQKAALANLVIAMILSVWVRGVNVNVVVLRCFFGLFFIGIVAAIFYPVFSQQAFISQLMDIVIRMIKGVLSGDADLTADVGFFESIYDRLSMLPAEALNYHDWSALWFGAGVFGGAGALGYPDFPMAHNGVVEILLIFGIPIGVFLNLFIVYFLVLSAARVFDGGRPFALESRFLLAAIGLFFLNNIFSGGGFFQPISASVFWLSFFRLRFLNKVPAAVYPA
ncbi:MAG: hypothetical protein Q7K57_61115 [Burkholderiaceae bacterium]|nr:hypothetical protein [Burkholderiaceae bacterium]